MTSLSVKEQGDLTDQGKWSERPNALPWVSCPRATQGEESGAGGVSGGAGDAAGVLIMVY